MPLDEGRRLEFLESAKKEFLLKGYIGASMRNIARSTSSSHSYLYYYYRTKEDLFKAVVGNWRKAAKENNLIPMAMVAEKALREAGTTKWLATLDVEVLKELV